MKSLLRGIRSLGIVGALIVAHIAVAYVLPAPLSSVSIIGITVPLLILRWEHGMVVWFAFVVFYIMELFSALPFGIVLSSGTLASLMVFWLYTYAFTNRSWYTASVLILCFGVMDALLQITGMRIADIVGMVDMSSEAVPFALRDSISRIVMTTVVGSIISIVSHVLGSDARTRRKLDWLSS